MTEPIPCPWCGCKEIRLETDTCWGRLFFYACTNMDCLAEGPCDLGKSGALEKWNKRYSPPPVERREKG